MHTRSVWHEYIPCTHSFHTYHSVLYAHIYNSFFLFFLFTHIMLQEHYLLTPLLVLLEVLTLCRFCLPKKTSVCEPFQSLLTLQPTLRNSASSRCRCLARCGGSLIMCRTMQPLRRQRRSSSKRTILYMLEVRPW